MTNILILGANGRIARHVVAARADAPAFQATLFVRQAARLKAPEAANLRVVQGDVLDADSLNAAMAGQDIVYANLTGDDIDDQAGTIIAAMQAAGVKRLIFVTSLGIYYEVPGRFGAWNRDQIGDYLPPFRRAADRIEASGLDYTILRPAWLSDADDVAYETTQKGEPFKGTEIARKAVAAYVLDLLNDPTRDIGGNVGLSQPGSDGDKPSFM